MRADLTYKDVNALADIAERIGTAPRGEVITVFVGRYRIEFHEVPPTFQGLASAINEDRLKTTGAKVRSLELDFERVKKETEYLEFRCAELGRLLAHARKTAAENLEAKRKLQARCAELEKRSAEHKANTKCEYCENTGRDCYGEVCEWCEEWDPKVI